MINISNTSTATHGPIQYTMHTAGPVALTTATHWPIQPLAQLGHTHGYVALLSAQKMPQVGHFVGQSGPIATAGHETLLPNASNVMTLRGSYFGKLEYGHMCELAA
ncbi:hypothetical protein Tco_1531459 [Tanacetum coccineum]